MVAKPSSDFVQGCILLLVPLLELTFFLVLASTISYPKQYKNLNILQDLYISMKTLFEILLRPFSDLAFCDKIMISSQLSQQARQDFAIVLRMAQSIGLADNPPLSQPMQPFIVNTPAKRTRQRRCNHSDLSHIQKEQKFRKVKERSASERARFTPQIVSSARKGSVKDVYVNSVQPYQDPSKFFQTQRQLLKNDEKRLLNMTRNSQRVKLMTRDKRRRSKILGQISEGVIAVSQPKKYTTAQKYFGQIKKSKVVTPRTVSQQKLSTSLDFSKFMVVPRGRGLSLLSRQGQNRRITQTANSKRIVNMHFNINNKAELLCEPPGRIPSEFQQF